MEVRESLYSHEIELPDDSHRKKIERVKDVRIINPPLSNLVICLN